MVRINYNQDSTAKCVVNPISTEIEDFPQKNPLKALIWKQEIKELSGMLSAKSHRINS